MPRPGPRPYECVRRAWHSDRHQPIRGSLIQELFRIVNEVHSPATRKNKEWQEKLPVVVLKAEEIMYSKANSEAEYVDFDTLWDRANDAINTIIRRDESTETGELLQPCIEAALHLGCTPRRASRSQRNNTPRCYLNPEKPENLENKAQGNYGINCPLIPQGFKLLTSNIMSSSNTCINLDTSVPNSCSVYPLYYGDQFYSNDPIFKNSFIRKADKEDVIEKHSSGGVNGAKVLFQPHSRPISETPPRSGCDLSLRLGPLEVSCFGSENRWPKEVEGVACKVGSKPSDGSFSQCDNSFSFFPKGNNAHGHSPVKWSHHRVAQNPMTEPGLKKRKADGVNHPSEDRQLCWPMKLPFKQFN